MLRRFSGKKTDARGRWRVVVIALAVLNLAALLWLLQPGQSAEDLEMELAALRSQVQQRQAALTRLRTIVKKVETARKQQEEFMSGYFMDRRTSSSTIVTEIESAAKQAGLKLREHAFTIDGIEGSDTLSLMTITANYEGSYADLVEFVYQVDKSKRFLMIDNITAAPQQTAGMLNARFKINTFVREQRP